MVIYLRPGSEGPGVVEVLFNLMEIIETFIYSRHGCEGLGMAEVVFNP